MFKPNFRYTSKIVNNLVEITSARETILNSHIAPKPESSLRKVAIIKSAHASTAIEDNPLALEEVDRLFRGLKVAATKKAKQEVLNYINVLKNIDEYSKNGKITEETILRLHKDVVKDTLKNPQFEGKYRDIQVYIINKAGETVFTPPTPEKVLGQTNNFIEWLNTYNDDEINPVIAAGIAHYEFLRIHPFIDGNGRTTRALVTLLLYLKKFDIKRFFALDTYYDEDRKAYYNALNSVDQKDLDTTRWLEYFSEGVLVSISKIKKQVLLLSSERRSEKI